MKHNVVSATIYLSDTLISRELMHWRDKLDPTLQYPFNDLLKRVSKEKKAYLFAKSPTQAQLWCALAILSKECADLQRQVQRLERSAKKPNTALQKSLKRL